MKITKSRRVLTYFPAGIGFLSLACCLALILALAMNANAQGGAKTDKKVSPAGNGGYKVDRLDESAIPANKKQEWSTVKQKLASEYTDCSEDCGQGDACEERCWEVFHFQLDREYQRILYESSP